MKYINKKNNYIVFVYILIFFIGFIIALFYKLNIDKTYNKFCENSIEQSKKELKNSVENLIIVIDEIRTNELSCACDDQIISDDILLNDNIKKQIHDLILNLKFYRNQYFWVNEIVNYEGGDDYAIRIIHQNLKDTEGMYLSTNIRDIQNNLPYKTELEGIIENGEIYQSYYFKNILDDRIIEKLSYAKLYKPYDWIVASGIPYEDIYAQANSFYKSSKSFLPIIYLIDLFFVILTCIAFTLYRKKKISEENEKLAIRKNMIKSEFIANMSHDLRTPLNAIVGLTELANNSNLDKNEIFDYLYKIDISSKFLLSLIDDILDISAIEEGKMSIRYNYFDIKDLIYPLVSLFYLQSHEKGIVFNCYCENIEFENLYGDVFRIKQIISNLLSNSIKFTDKGGYVNLIIKQLKNNDNTVSLLIEVKDSGCGIEKAQLDKIFNKFEQASDSVKEKYGGSGLGLSIVKSLVYLMDGKINVQSRINEGTSFIINLDFTYEENEIKNNNIINKKILVIDNEKSCNSINAVCKKINIESDFDNTLQNGINRIKNNNKKKKTYDYILVNIDFENTEEMIYFEELQNIVNLSLTKILVLTYVKNYVNFNQNFGFVNKPILKSSLIELFDKDRLESNIVSNSSSETVDGLCVLVVEDNEINQLVAKKIIESKKAIVEIANNGQEAIQIFEDKGNNYFDLILMDYQMPIINGIEATKIIRKSSLSYSNNIKIYAMTANTTREDVSACLLAGMDGHISKPIDVKLLMQILIDIYNKKSKK